MRTSKYITGKNPLVATIGLMLSATAFSQSSFDGDGALSYFKKRAFLEPNDVAAWSSSIGDLVGTYIIKDENGNIQLTMDKVSEKSQGQLIDLKDDTFFNNRTEGSTAINFTLLNLLNIGGTKNQLDELTITDLARISNSSVDSSTCQKNYPKNLAGGTKYFCVTALVISKISINKYKKTKSSASGTYAILTTSGNYALDKSLTTIYKVASISTIGPYVVPVTPTAAATPVAPTPPTAAVTPAAPTPLTVAAASSPILDQASKPRSDETLTRSAYQNLTTINIEKLIQNANKSKTKNPRKEIQEETPNDLTGKIIRIQKIPKKD